METMSDACGEWRIALGAYVVGALEAEERDAVEDHLAGCAGCREELTMLATVPAALSRLRGSPGFNAESVLATEERSASARPMGGAVTRPGGAKVRPSLLERTVAELARRRRSRLLRWRLALGSAAVMVGALGTTVGILAVNQAPTTVVAARMSGADSSTGVSADAALVAEDWGTSIQLDIKGVTPGDQCELVAVTSNGSQQVAGTWRVGYTGAVTLDGATGLSPRQISELRVVTTSGVELVDLAA